MDTAKVIINIKDGLIELSGPVDFVRQYLDKYQSAIKIETVPEKIPAIPAVKPAPRLAKAVKEPIIPAAAPAAAAPAPTPTPATTPVAAKTKPETCIGAIRNFIQSGFFNEPRLLSDVRRHLDEENVNYSERAVRAGLTRLAKSGKLRMAGKGRGKRYSRPEK
jgi:hypothetical protein